MGAITRTVRTVLGMTALGLASVVTLAGDLDPPAGAVSSTMRTLDQVEPRLIVNSANAPGGFGTTYQISSPGSYYLEGPITGQSFRGSITISSSDVTLDLSGYRMSGGPDNFNGVYVDDALENIVIRNGIIVDRQGGYAIRTDLAAGNVRIEDIEVRDCAGGIFTGPDTVVERCSVRDGTGTANPVTAGIQVGDDSIVRDCVSTGNDDQGFGLGAGSIAERCVASGNGSHGFRGLGPCTVTLCTAQGNSQRGFQLDMAATVRECLASENAGDGIYAATRAMVRDCLVRENGGDGIELGDACLALENHCYGNDFRGINVVGGKCTVDSNKCTFDGITLSSNDNVVVRNDVTGNSIVNGGVNNHIGPTNSLTSPWTNWQ